MDDVGDALRVFSGREIGMACLEIADAHFVYFMNNGRYDRHLGDAESFLKTAYTYGADVGGRIQTLRSYRNGGSGKA